MRFISLIITALLLTHSVCCASIGFPFPGPGRINLSEEQPQTVTAYDEFDGVENTYITSHTSDTGDSWSSTAESALKLTGGGMVYGNNTVAQYHMMNHLPSNNYYQVNGYFYVVENASAIPGNIGVGGWMTSVGVGGYFTRYSPYDSSIKLYKGASVQIGSTYTVSPSLAVGSTHKLSIKMDAGNIISVLLDNITVISLTDSTYTSGYPFLRTYCPDAISSTEISRLEVIE